MFDPYYDFMRRWRFKHANPVSIIKLEWNIRICL